MDTLTIIIVAMVTGLLGFIFGNLKFHREEKYKAYREFLSPIVKFVFERDNQNEYNEALQKLWVFAGKRVVKKMDIVASRVIDPNRGNLVEALQELIEAMRNDIQPWSFCRINASEIKHIYTFAQQESQNEQNK